MLTYQKNKLLNKLLSFEMAFNEIRAALDDKTNALQAAGKYSEASAHSYITDIIKRNIESIKTQLEKV